MMAAPQPTPAHRAALTLHALGEGDRQWVLEALSGEQRAALRPLLEQLEELGIPREADFARAIIHDHAGEDRRDASTLESLDAAGVRRLASSLCAEPPRVAAALLASRPWPWREQLLSELPVAFSRAVDRMTPVTTGAGALQAAVIAELAPCVSIEAAERPPASLSQMMRRRLGALKGRP